MAFCHFFLSNITTLQSNPIRMPFKIYGQIEETKRFYVGRERIFEKDQEIKVIKYNTHIDCTIEYSSFKYIPHKFIY